MPTREVVAVLVLALASSPASGQEADEASGLGLSAAALAAAGAAALFALKSRDKSEETTATAPARTPYYGSAAEFRTSEYAAQTGLAAVRAETLYYNGHMRWAAGGAPDPAAGTGVGVKIAIGDTGINPREAATGSAIAIDANASYDYVANRAGNGADDYGHGTHVAGILAAPKNGAGMHGLAYNATLVSFKLGGATITASDAQRGDMLARAAAAGAMIANNSWATDIAITARSAAELQQIMPGLIAGARAYVGAGGVVVFAAGNGARAQPSLEAGLPYRVGELAPGWLAVVAIDQTGALGGYSNRCGVAASWCLAAPGGSFESGIWSMQNNGGYAAMYGTSMAAPHAAAALAALKSMFPNLTWQQLRDRLLFTANRSGAYADASTYGQGLMDLDTASSPVGGVAMPTGASAGGAVAPVEGSGVQFPAGTLAALGMQGAVLVVDNYQRAPFWMPARTFFTEAAPRLLERQWASLRTSGRNHVASARTAGYRFGFAHGAGGESALGADLALAWLPRLAAPELDTVALGYATQMKGIRFGLMGTIPGEETNSSSLDSSSLGRRRALGAVAQRELAGTTYGLSFALADGFERPIGVPAAGAFGVGSGGAASGGVFVERALGQASVLTAAFETAHHRPQAAAGALEAPGYALRSASLGARTRLARRTTLSASVKREWSADAALLHVPLTIDAAGSIGRVTYVLPYEDLVGRSSLGLRLDHELARDVSLRASLTRERSGFGALLTGVAAIVEIAY